MQAMIWLRWTSRTPAPLAFVHCVFMKCHSLPVCTVKFILRWSAAEIIVRHMQHSPLTGTREISISMILAGILGGGGGGVVNKCLKVGGKPAKNTLRDRIPLMWCFEQHSDNFL